MFLRSLACLSLAACAMVLAVSEAQAMDMTHHQHTAATATPATQAYQQAMVKMHQARTPLSGNPDVDFVRLMIPHHQAALDMAQAQLLYGRDETLKTFSRWVIFAQTIEIGYMQNWLRGHDNGLSSPTATDYYSAAMKRMHADMMVEPTGDPDTDFVRGMIPHHQAAVDMVSVWMKHGVNPELRTLTDDVLRAQTYEIAWQRYWLTHRDDPTCFPSFIF